MFEDTPVRPREVPGRLIITKSKDLAYLEFSVVDSTAPATDVYYLFRYRGAWEYYGSGQWTTTLPFEIEVGDVEYYDPERAYVEVLRTATASEQLDVSPSWADIETAEEAVQQQVLRGIMSAVLPSATLPFIDVAEFLGGSRTVSEAKIRRTVARLPDIQGAEV